MSQESRENWTYEQYRERLDEWIHKNAQRKALKAQRAESKPDQTGGRRKGNSRDASETSWEGERVRTAHGDAYPSCMPADLLRRLHSEASLVFRRGQGAHGYMTRWKVKEFYERRKA